MAKAVDENLNLAILRSLFTNEDLTDQVSRLLIAVATAANFAGVDLGRQIEEIQQGIKTQVKRYAKVKDLNIEQIAGAIYQQVEIKLLEQQKKNQDMHKAGNFDNIALHQCPLNTQMQDHDMAKFMPKTHGNVEVLALVNRLDLSSKLVQQGIQAALDKADVKHIMIPVGPGHYRGVYITKLDNDQYRLELFDPYGPEGAKTIEKLALDWLKECNIEKEQVEIHATGPQNIQADAHACGDYTCAYFHKEMEKTGADSSAYNPKFIQVLDTVGNRDNRLRVTFREASKALAPKEPLAGHPLAAKKQLPEERKSTKLDKLVEQIGTNPHIKAEEMGIQWKTNKKGQVDVDELISQSIFNTGTRVEGYDSKANFDSKKSEQIAEQLKKAELTPESFKELLKQQIAEDEKLARKLQAEEVEEFFKAPKP